MASEETNRKQTPSRMAWEQPREKLDLTRCRASFQAAHLTLRKEGKERAEDRTGRCDPWWAFSVFSLSHRLLDPGL